MDKNIKNNIAFVDESTLGFRSNRPGHYVFISDFNSETNTCSVYSFTSLESKPVFYDKFHKGYKYSFNNNKISKVRNDMLLPLAHNKNDFKKWTALTNNCISGIPLDKLQDIGKKTLSKQQLFEIKRFLNKNSPPQ